MKSYWFANTYSSRHMHKYQPDKQAPAEAVQITVLLKYFISNPFSQSSTFVGAQYQHTIETWWRLGFQNTDQRGIFNQPRSLCVFPSTVVEGRFWENRRTVAHLYSLQMACVGRIMQIWDFSHRIKTQLSCSHTHTHTHPYHSKILFMALQSA